MKNAVAEPETEAPPMDKSPAAMRTARRRPNHVVGRKLGQLEACLAKALLSRPRRSDLDGSLYAEIQARTDFLRTLIAAEGECHGGARPEDLVEAEARFGVLERTFEQWAQSGAAAPTEEEPEAAAGSGSAGCSCTDSCFVFECTGQEVTFDAKCEPERGAAEAHKAAAATEVPPMTARRPVGRRWWRRRAALCGAAGAVAVVALGAGLVLEFAAVAHQTVCLVPT